MKSLKMAMGQSESVNRRRIDNTIAKRKRTNNVVLLAGRSTTIQSINTIYFKCYITLLE